jgi:Domain of unknown function (DUF397)
MEGKDMNWRKSSYSGGNGGSCVEVANTDHIMVRDTTQHGTGPVLAFTTSAWKAFTAQLKRSLGTPQPRT